MSIKMKVSYIRSSGQFEEGEMEEKASVKKTSGTARLGIKGFPCTIVATRHGEEKKQEEKKKENKE